MEKILYLECYSGISGERRNAGSMRLILTCIWRRTDIIMGKSIITVRNITMRRNITMGRNIAMGRSIIMGRNIATVKSIIMTKNIPTKAGTIIPTFTGI